MSNKTSKTIKELPEDQRPREKLLKYGADTLSDAELLAILLRTGTKGKSAIEMAEEIIKNAGGLFKGLAGKDIEDITKTPRVSCAYLLGDMYGFMPTDLQDKLIDLLLHSGYAPIRRRCYELLDRHWRPSFQSVAEESWHRKKEPASARLAVKRLPPEFLVANFDELHELIKPHEITQLYARASEKDPRILERLKGSDDITYVYILQKCGQKVGDAEALAMVDRNIDNDRLGLLVWCLGRMGLWSVLFVIYEDTKKDVFKYRRLHW